MEIHLFSSSDSSVLNASSSMVVRLGISEKKILKNEKKQTMSQFLTKEFISKTKIDFFHAPSDRFSPSTIKPTLFEGCNIWIAKKIKELQ